MAKPKNVKAVRGFIAHKEGQHRRFAAGEIIPEDWWDRVGTRSLVDQRLPHMPEDPEPGPDAEEVEGGSWPEDVVAGYETVRAESVDVMIEWVLDDKGPGDKHLRAKYARVQEGEGKRRSTAIRQLGEIIRDAPPVIEVSDSDPLADDPATT